MMMKFITVVVQSVGLAVHASNGDVCRKGPMKILVKRSSTYRKFSVSLMSLGREKETGECISGFCY
jgi:hypothetical protein